MDYKDKEILRNLFNSALYLEIFVAPEVRRNPPRNARGIINNDDEPSAKRVFDVLSPQSVKILASFSPETQMKLATDFIRDERNIQRQIGILDLDDPNYVNYNSSQVGTDLEYWVCVNMTCPGCNGKLYKYANPNMPAVDVICINPNHTLNNGPKFYQIKTTEAGTVHKGLLYFSLEDEYICVGSPNFGYNCHVMTFDDEYKDILVGYICLAYRYNNDKTRIRLDITKSFILIPNLLFEPKNDEERTSTYYNYIQLGPTPVIKFNTNMIKVIRLSTPSDIPLNIKYDANKLEIELPKLLDIQSKYLIMKMKYLNLKKLIASSK